MEDAIRDFPAQFTFEPLVENHSKLASRDAFVVCGMGGSNLPADILCAAEPEIDILRWRDYGLPPGNLKNKLAIISSYSGNTEEAISGFEAALESGIRPAVITKGGALLELARTHKTPYVAIPGTDIQPRQAAGFMLRGLLAVMGRSDLLRQTRELAATLRPEKFEDEGARLARAMKGSVPLIYASRRNAALARNWKIKFNENGKIPAFWNEFPELNHNEMTGFDHIGTTRPLSRNFHFLFITDSEDNPRILRRMDIMEGLLGKRGFSVSRTSVSGETRYERIFSNLLLADWTTYKTAIAYGAEPIAVPMVEEFKKMI